MAKRNKVVMIMGFPIEVEFSTDRIVDKDGLPLFGEYDRWTDCIRIDGTVAKAIQRSTLVHELLHATLTKAKTKLSEDAEEHVVESLEGPIFCLVKDKANRWLLDYFSEE